MRRRQINVGRFFAVGIAAAIGCGLGGCGTGLDGEVPPETLGTTVDGGDAARTPIPTDEAEGEPREAVQGPEGTAVEGGTTGEVESPDTVPPEVTTVSPAAESTDVATDTAIQLTWSEAIDPATVTATSVTVVSFSSRLGVATTVAGTLTVSDTLVTFTPMEPLASGRQYTINVTTDVRDPAGNALAGEFRSSFTTRAFQGNTLVHLPN